MVPSLSPWFVTGISEVPCTGLAWRVPAGGRGTGRSGRAAVPTSQRRRASWLRHIAAEGSAGDHVSASGGALTLGCSVAFQAVTLFICHISGIGVSISHLLLFLCIMAVTQLSKRTADPLEGLM